VRLSYVPESFQMSRYPDGRTSSGMESDSSDEEDEDEEEEEVDNEGSSWIGVSCGWEEENGEEVVGARVDCSGGG
jgi:hypothetical protein